MKRAALQAIVFLFAMSYHAVALTNELLLPQPARLATCDNEHPKGIVGVWRQDFIGITNADKDSFTSTFSLGTNSSSTQTNTLLTINEDTFTYHLPVIGEISRSYKIIGGSSNRYVVELSDREGATLISTIEAVLCGLAVEQRSPCHAEFCINTLKEITERIVPQSEDFEALLQQSLEANANQPETKTRTLYRRVVEE